MGHVRLPGLHERHMSLEMDMPPLCGSIDDGTAPRSMSVEMLGWGSRNLSSSSLDELEEGDAFDVWPAQGSVEPASSGKGSASGKGSTGGGEELSSPAPVLSDIFVRDGMGSDRGSDRYLQDTGSVREAAAA